MERVNSGLTAVGGVPWGTHFCQFYDHRDDLIDVTVPFFKAGLEGDERCLWVTAEPLGAEEATAVLRSAVGDIDARLKRKQIEIIDHRDWYMGNAGRSAADVANNWLAREVDALASGYRGFRLNGNTSFLERSGWNEFKAYEATVDALFRSRRIVAMCSYCLSRLEGADVADVGCNHQFALLRRDDKWERVDSANLPVAQAVLRRAKSDGAMATAPTTLGDLLYSKIRPSLSEQDWVGLVQAVAAGEQLALHALYERAHRLVFTLAMRITANRETAEELTVDVFHDVWRRASQYDAADGTVLGWLMNQPRSRAIDRLRFEHRKKRQSDGDLALLAELAVDPSDALELREQGESLRAALTTLTPDEREAIETTFFGGLTHIEAAARLNQPLGTIKTRIRSGLQKLRKALGPGAGQS